ncbi:MAG: tetratricopeptide repeat protein [Streptosporangiaceae bacterium]|nr:tetratricopeptide repeat protein [Streptosporangiaceae bacterium]MBV9854850.1 tetratricopeptide repeat protein [Streptosporangiaceae bacterium]
MTQLEFGILGPLQVRCGDRPVALTRRRERIVLAALLVGYGKVVPVDDLVLATWGEEPPSTARRQITMCISRIRGALAAAGGTEPAIATSDPGYLVSGGVLDALRAEQLASRAHAARSAGRPAAAAELLNAALSLWRGPALADIGRPFAEIEATRLEERRSALAAELIDLKLDLGRHEELTGELFALVSADPLRERSRAQLMLALYRSGRPAEALEVYRSGRQRLVESLGLEPGAGLRQLQQAILRADPVLAAPRPAVETTAVPDRAGRTGADVPAQLPADVAAFTGRSAELEDLDTLAAGAVADGGLADGPPRVAVIAGMAGVGKTGLAVRWSHRAVRRFPDGQLFADLRGYDAHQEPLAPAAVLGWFLRALGVPAHEIPAPPADRAALFRTVVTGRRLLIVLDNARTSEQVRPLLPGSGTCFVLITSRGRLDDLIAHDGAWVCRLDALERGEAARLLARICGKPIDPATADRIAALCDRLPLALRIAAAQLAGRAFLTPGELAERLRDEQRRLHELSGGQSGVRISIGLSYRELPAPAAGLFRQLGMLDARDFAAWPAAALADTTERAADDLLDQLVAAGLLEPAGIDVAGQSRYRLHDLTRLFAREQTPAAATATARRGAMRRVLGAALRLAEQADAALGNPFVPPLYGDSPRHPPDDRTLRRAREEPLAWLEAERTTLVGAAAQAARLGLASYAWELTSALSQFLSTRRYLDDWQDCAELAVAAARAAGDQRGEATALLQLADRLGEAGRFSDAAAAIDRATALVSRSDVQALAVCLTTRALINDRGPDSAVRAQRDAEHALALLGDSGDAASVSRALHALGLSVLDQGNYTAAADCFRRVLRIQQRAGSTRGQAEARYRLGTTRLRQGEYATASRLLTDAMRAAAQAGDLMTAMIARIRLGQAYAEMGQPDQARPLLEYAVRHVSADDSARFRALALETLGHVLQAQHQPEQAAPLLAEASQLRADLPAKGDFIKPAPNL